MATDTATMMSDYLYSYSVLCEEESEKNIEVQLERLQYEQNNPKQWVLVITAYYYAK